MGMIKLKLQMFAEEGGAEGAAAPAAEAAQAPAAEAAENPAISEGDTLPTGETASKAVAAAMNRQMQKHPELRKVYGQRPNEVQPEAKAEAGKTLEQEWDELKKGRFADLYGRDVQNTIQDRFKNAKNAQDELDRAAPALEILRKRAGVESNDELFKMITDDDSAYEEEASEAGMTTEAYKQFKQMESELNRRKEAEQQSLQQQMVRNHLAKLSQQAEEFKQIMPGFDLQAELKANPTFMRLTSPSVGLSVKDAYFACHHDELAPRLMTAGMERAKKQMGQTIQAQRARPTEGAMKPAGKPSGEVGVDIRKMTRNERNRLYEFVHKKGSVTLN